MLESQLRLIIQNNLSIVLKYDPYSRFKGVTTKEDFFELIKNDPAFSPFFLHNSKYLTARIGGNLITSLHRKLGDMYEDIFKKLLQIKLNIPDENLSYSVQLNVDGQMQERSTDGLILLSNLEESNKQRFLQFLKASDQIGLGYEVRSCYQIGDSKRIQADRDMSLALLNVKIQPVMLVFCNTSLPSPLSRLSNYWQLFQGEAAFEHVEAITGFNLFDFLKNESATIEPLMKKIFDMM